jgi:hypothetical protein
MKKYITLFTMAALSMPVFILSLPQGTAAQVRANTTLSCTTFTTNLRIGDRGAAVGRLQAALEAEGFEIADSDKPQRDGQTIANSTFGESTASAVVEFQEKYASEILRPSGLRRGTGYVGPSTRAKLNALLNCGKTPRPTPTPVTPFVCPAGFICRPITPQITPTPTPTPTTNVCPTGFVCPPNNPTAYITDPNISGSATLISASEDKVYKWAAGSEVHSSDWKWQVSITNGNSNSKTVTKMVLVHNAAGEGWATDSSSDNPVGKVLRSLGVTNGQCDTCGFNRTWTENLNLTFAAGETKNISAYGEPASWTFSGGYLMIYFTDGTRAKITIPSSSIRPGSSDVSVPVVVVRPSVSAYLADASSDKVSANFNPGVGISNKNPNDWHWVATIRKPSNLTIESMTILSNSYGEGWSTSNNSSQYGKVLYPIAFYLNGQAVNTSYNQFLATSDTSLTLDLYGQPETVPFSGGTLTVRFSDGTSASTNISSSSISPINSAVASLKVMTPNGGETLTQDQNTLIRWSGGTYPVQIGVVRASFPNDRTVEGWIQLRGNANDSITWDTHRIGDLTVGGQWWFINPGQYKIIVVSANAQGNYCFSGSDCVYDVSDSSFTINAAAAPVTMTVGASLESASENRVGIDRFSPGSSMFGDYASDWKWNITLSGDSFASGQIKQIKSITVYHNSVSEGWSTSASSNNDLHKNLYPLLLVADGASSTAYDQDIGSLSASKPSITFAAYGQIETGHFNGGRVVVTFSDGTSVSGNISSSAIVPSTPNAEAQSAAAVRAFQQMYYGN